jgi:VanZ family protein
MPNLTNSARVGLVLALVVVTWLAVMPQGIPFPGESDKLAHASAFLALGLLADFSFPLSSFGAAKILPLLGYGLGIEFVQLFEPGRVASLVDWLADGLGLALYPLLIPVLQRLPLLRRRWSQPLRQPEI